jgi:hypothetical protein
VVRRRGLLPHDPSSLREPVSLCVEPMPKLIASTSDELLCTGVADVLLPVQKAALGVFQKFTSLPREELWHELMDVLTGLLRPEQLEQVKAHR